jgi:sulfatase maturation enzyme AslB (radical SAM superfamily)
LNRGVFPAGCKNCQSEEAQGLQSLRIKRKDIFKAAAGELVDLELFVGSLCNMKCRMCDPNHSSLWSRELGEPMNSGYDPVAFFEKIDLHNLQHLRLLGGETLINKDFFRILDHVDRQSRSSQITLSFATNGSREIDDKIKSYLLKFKSVEVDFSIDGTGALAEYIRPGVAWSKIEANISGWVDFKKQTTLPMNLNVHTTIQSLNAHAIFDIVDFCIKHRLSWSHRVLTEPNELSWLRLPISVREEICRMNNSALDKNRVQEFFASRNHMSLFKILTQSFPGLEIKDSKELISYLEFWDSRWKTSWRSVMPSFWQHSFCQSAALEG